MSDAKVAVQNPGASLQRVFRVAYRCLAYFGLASVFGSLLHGFRFDPGAPNSNYLVNLGLYAAFAAPHLIMTRSWWKKALWRSPTGSPQERQFYILTSVVTWLAVLYLQRPLPGYYLVPAGWLPFAGGVIFILAVMAFFQGMTFSMIDGFLGVPGSGMNFSHGSETPLMTEGPYADVRHPMYRAALFGGLATLLIHPNLGQVFWAGLIGLTFIAFIPIEERQLITARGEAYREYQRNTPYRLIRGIW